MMRSFSLGAALAVDHFLDFFEERLAHFGWAPVWEKSNAWIPRLDLLDEIPSELVADTKLFARIPRASYGLKALKSVEKRATHAARSREELQKWLLLESRYRSRQRAYDARVCRVA